jgi:hypothetical protein
MQNAGIFDPPGPAKRTDNHIRRFGRILSDTRVREAFVEAGVQAGVPAARFSARWGGRPA